MRLSELPGAGSQLEEMIRRRKQVRTDLEKVPPVIVLADIFKQEGSYGFRESMKQLESQLESAGVALVPDKEFFQQIPDKYRSLMEEQYGAIVFGRVIINI